MISKNEVKRFGNVAVLMGGDSAEREISLQSGEAILAALKKAGVAAVAVDAKKMQLSSLEKFDSIFIALHGRGGEDGSMQGLLDLLDIPYTGSGILASALAMDKIRCKQLWRGIGLSTPKFYIAKDERQLERIAAEAAFPLMVKPSREGSSIGMTKVETADELLDAYQKAKHYDEVLLEQYIEGREYTVAILGGQILPPIRLETPRTFYDYRAKYLAEDTKYHCPCGLEGEQLAQLEQLALWAFDSLDCEGWGRVDLMMDSKGEFYVLEVNTVPGMTSHSLVPMAAKQANIEFPELVVRILRESIK